MAERRMFSRSIIDSDAFLDMPLSAQSLYFHLSMRADDEGFVNNPKKIQRMIGASDDDLKLLFIKSFLIVFESGVVVIKHWYIHNKIRMDRYKPTVYIEEKALVHKKENGAYTLDENKIFKIDQSELPTNCQPNDNQMLDVGHPKLSKHKQSKDKISEESKKPTPIRNKYGEYGHVLLSADEFDKLNSEYEKELTLASIKRLDEYCEMNGKSYKNCYLAIKKWVINAVLENKKIDNSLNVGETSNKFMEVLLKNTQGAI